MCIKLYFTSSANLKSYISFKSTIHLMGWYKYHVFLIKFRIVRILHLSNAETALISAWLHWHHKSCLAAIVLSIMQIERIIKVAHSAAISRTPPRSLRVPLHYCCESSDCIPRLLRTAHNGQRVRVTSDGTRRGQQLGSSFASLFMHKTHTALVALPGCGKCTTMESRTVCYIWN